MNARPPAPHIVYTFGHSSPALLNHMAEGLDLEHSHVFHGPKNVAGTLALLLIFENGACDHDGL